MRNQKLNKAINLRSSGKHRESNKLLVQLAREIPDNTSINYQYALSFDILVKKQKQSLFMKRSSNLGCHQKNW